jgi:hypothetical protein
MSKLVRGSAIAIGGLLVLGGGVAAVALALTYSGLCIPQMRYVSDDEKIRSVVSGLLGYRDKKYFRNTEAGIIEVPGPREIEYSSVDEFLELNEGCCSIGPRGGDGYEEPTFLRRLFGSLADIVVVDYVYQYVDERGVQHSDPVTRQVAVDVCGHVPKYFVY